MKNISPAGNAEAVAKQQVSLREFLGVDNRFFERRQRHNRAS
jgi:hypothetical protein